MVRIGFVSRWLSCVFVAAAVLLLPGRAAAQAAFKSFEGAWGGAGRIVLEGGNSERLTCRANYSQRSGGNSLGLSIRCASSSYKIELRASLVQTGGNVTGIWEERTFNAEGTLSGRASGNVLNLAFRGAISGSMLINVAERQQRVSITAAGTGFHSVSISLTKS